MAALGTIGADQWFEHLFGFKEHEALRQRMRATVGLRLSTLSAGGTFGSGVSAAKVNDLKPMWGVVFADMLARYAWWGYLQEDLLLGDLRAFLTPALLATHDVICPYLAPVRPRV